MTTVVYAIALAVLLGFMVYKGALKHMFAALDKRAEKITAEIENARDLRRQAQINHKASQRELAVAEGARVSIAEVAKASAQDYTKTRRADIERAVDHVIRQGKQRILHDEHTARLRWQRKIAGLAEQVAADVVMNTSQANKNRITKDSIQRICSSLN